MAEDALRLPGDRWQATHQCGLRSSGNPAACMTSVFLRHGAQEHSASPHIASLSRVSWGNTVTRYRMAKLYLNNFLG
jgi:hypothetical protein